MLVFCFETQQKHSPLVHGSHQTMADSKIHLSARQRRPAGHGQQQRAQRPGTLHCYCSFYELQAACTEADRPSSSRRPLAGRITA